MIVTVLTGYFIWFNLNGSRRRYLKIVMIDGIDTVAGQVYGDHSECKDYIETTQGARYYDA